MLASACPRPLTIAQLYCCFCVQLPGEKKSFILPLVFVVTGRTQSFVVGRTQSGSTLEMCLAADPWASVANRRPPASGVRLTEEKPMIRDTQRGLVSFCFFN